ncbi:hypothetical protein [Salmonella enterica]|uniref:hypothetical protein n=1 Tax=Salmonella enterica TaxID=28901 RepID=UPI000CDA5936|nr:hypothetical protein [Salmonella enterica]POP05333.1 hypothetical protein CQJ33_25630 [Salmonella enterica subsp. enterica serovar Heidelberg]
MKMPAFEWVHVQLHQQKGMISLSPPTICNSAENSILRGLKFLDAWTVTGSTDAPVLRDEWGNDWRDITR